VLLPLLEVGSCGPDRRTCPTPAAACPRCGGCCGARSLGRHGLPDLLVGPRGPDGGLTSTGSRWICCPCARVGRTSSTASFKGDMLVAPVPAWAGRPRRRAGGNRASCPCARVGRTVLRCSYAVTYGVAPVPAWAGLSPFLASRTCTELPLCPRGPDTWQTLGFDPLEGPQVSEVCRGTPHGSR
jgi:hypothetical protein